MKILLPSFHFSELTITRLLCIHTEFSYAYMLTYMNCSHWFLKSEVNYSYYFEFFFFSSYLRLSVPQLPHL